MTIFICFLTVANDLAISKVKKNTEQKHLYTVDAYMDVAVHLEKDPHPAFSGVRNAFLFRNLDTIFTCT